MNEERLECEHTPSSPVKEKEREGERERDVEYVQNCYF